MTTVLLIIQILVAIGLVAVVLMQRSEGGALGIGGGGPGGMVTGRGAANLLTRTTMILGAIFMANSIALAVLPTLDTTGRSVIDRVGADQDTGPLPFTFDDEDAPAVPDTDETPQDVPAPFEGEAEDAPADEEPGR
ncbi:MAG: preprotein translocase subunit SecG [Oceanicaulis sp.]|uniref:preprotein translocase subunit SecG n=1 Tax=Glycocaulis sp. TaxID=1969725 RepID=UPI0025C2933C|nr:preprotein translocase subunit SecG [Glycocaulis sp.]MCC5982549.1 preprotein translocase subunit SecG [Oceanicaulis sp.]MCH8521394.1 preprotein translocase subunit SecG [Glycocaulis sp.]